MFFINVGRGQRGVRIVDAGWSPGKDKAFGVKRGYFFPGSGMRDQFAINLKLAHSPGDKHAILGTEINNDYGFTLWFFHRFFGFSWFVPSFFFSNFQISGYFNITTGCYS
jgi:hypothetical protein